MTKTEYNKKYYADNKAHLRAQTEAWRTENRERNLAQMRNYREKTKDRWVQYDRDRYDARLPQTLIRLREAYLADPQKKKAYNKARYEAKKPEIAAQKKRYQQANMKLVLKRNADWIKRNPDKAKAIRDRYMAKYPGKITAKDALRRARILNAKTDVDAVKQFFTWVRNQEYVTCTYCGRYITGKGIEIDHIVPISRGGDHLPDNFCVSCRSCNASKHDRLLSEWPECPAKFKNLN